VGNDVAPTGIAARLNCLHGFGNSPYLVELDEYGITRSLFDATPNQHWIGYVKIVADNLNSIPQQRCLRAKPLPIVFCKPVFDRDDPVGKTSLMNAILGIDRLPTGITPLTSVITSVAYGSEEKVVLTYQQWVDSQGDSH
jgi:hypothetical protein